MHSGGGGAGGSQTASVDIRPSDSIWLAVACAVRRSLAAGPGLAGGIWGDYPGWLFAAGPGVVVWSCRGKTVPTGSMHWESSTEQVT
jgi:hypothetical protein